ncbi:hypothetical protein BH11PSE12_BH11PSE12_14390 [soil metagenome]
MIALPEEIRKITTYPKLSMELFSVSGVYFYFAKFFGAIVVPLSGSLRLALSSIFRLRMASVDRQWRLMDMSLFILSIKSILGELKKNREINC